MKKAKRQAREERKMADAAMLDAISKALWAKSENFVLSYSEVDAELKRRGM